jgi:glycosyltransferase involved in cell wall biosynthesis
VAGVNSEHFFPTRKINKITTLGLNGIPFVNKGWDLIKRPDMMVDITHKAKLKYKFINNQPLTDHHNLYKDIDMYICTSVNEAGPYGIAEAAFCKIPVISTPVGYALKFKSIKTFTTVDEAVSIINDLNSNPKKLEKYINDVYEELTRNLNWKHVAKTYWKPLIEKRLNSNKT